MYIDAADPDLYSASWIIGIDQTFSQDQIIQQIREKDYEVIRFERNAS